MKTLYLFLPVACLFLTAFNMSAFAQVGEGQTPLGFKFAPSNGLPVQVMPAINVDSMLQEDAINEQNKANPYRFGYNHLVYFSLANSGLWTTLPNGDRIWQIDVKTPGSVSINLAFSNFYLPNGAKLFIYSKDHSQVLGAYTSVNNTPDKFFGSELLNDDEAVVEYDEPADVSGQGSLILFRVTQGYKDIRSYLRGFGNAGGCINNANCPQYEPYWTQKRAVCLVSTGNSFCSGSLINDNLNDGTPYLLTANHCGTADGTWFFRFNWEAPGCPDPATEPDTVQTIFGGQTKANDTLSDFNLVLLNSKPPCSYHVFYNGWSRSTTPADSVTCFHHPEGDIKKCSRASNPVKDTVFYGGTYTAEVWEIGLWTDGVTEPGSSGSPLLDQNNRIVGQLFGGPSACGALESNLHDFYGRFNVSWDSGTTPATRLKDWLDPGNTNAMTNNGYEPCPPTDSFDIAAVSIASPVDSSCGDSIFPVIEVWNLGASTVTSFIVNYYVDGESPVVYHWTGSLVYLQYTTVSLPPIPVTTGVQAFHANVSQPNGVADQNPLNDSVFTGFTIESITGEGIPFTEGFEESFFPPNGWSVTTPPSGNTWIQDNVGAFGISAHCAAVNEFEPPCLMCSTLGETPQLISPAVSLANAVAPAFLQFDEAYALYDSIYVDSLAVLVSINCGASWNRIYVNGGASLATGPDDDSTPFVPTASQWAAVTVNISELIGQPAVLFSFEVISGEGQYVYLDNINISEYAGIRKVAGTIVLNAFPDPFRDKFSLQFDLDEAQAITANLYSVDGRRVSNVLNNETMPAGSHLLEVNTQALSNGLYILKVNNSFIRLEKM